MPSPTTHHSHSLPRPLRTGGDRGGVQPLPHAPGPSGSNRAFPARRGGNGRAWLLAGLLLASGTAAAAPSDAAQGWRDARQMVLVIVRDWNADHGTLRTFVRDGDGWRAQMPATPVVIGRHGAAWGLGLQPAQAGDGPAKREGDLRSPAGVFRIGTTFGYAAHADTAMPYRASTATDYCVDVSGTRYYNRIVDAAEVGRDAVEGATEPMRRDLAFHGDQRYRLGFFIDSNPQAKPGHGSCIFGHIWKSPHTATAGCTAMTGTTMERLVAWMKPQDRPVFVLLPQGQYERLRAAWKLPRIAAR